MLVNAGIVEAVSASEGRDLLREILEADGAGRYFIKILVDEFFFGGGHGG